jgi:hypothetical protein
MRFVATKSEQQRSGLKLHRSKTDVSARESVSNAYC